jgi:hypothetical protein
MQMNWLNWTTAGAGIPIGTGVTRFPVDIVSDAVARLATTEGIYNVEFRATDRLARMTTVARCFDLHLRAPPLDLDSASTSRPTKDHAYALDSLSLAPGALYDQIAARLLNADATGASLIDQDIFNGTTSTIYLTVTVTPPSEVTAAQTFVLDNAPTQVSDATCGGACTDAAEGPTFSLAQPMTTPETSLHFPAKVFELVNGAPATELPCLAPCPPSGRVFRFAIPPRASGSQPARAFRVMTMIGSISALRPRDGNHEASPPFEDTAITWTNGSRVTTTTRFTGIVDHSNVPERTGCVRHDPNDPDVCEQEGTFVPYRALRSAALTFSDRTLTSYKTAVTTSQPPALVGDKYRRGDQGWATAEGVLP